MKFKSFLIAAGSAIALATVTANASTINYFQDAGSPYQTPALSTYTTTGSQMSGMDVWVTYSDGSVQHTVWATTGADSGAATVSGYFSMSETGTTFNDGAWALENLNSTLAITSFTLLGAGGNTVFDRTFGGAIGTPNSAYGKDFTIAGAYTCTVTYSDILNLTGAPAVGDEFVELQVAFAANTSFGPHTSAAFTQDTDNAAVNGSITTVPDVASTGILLGLSCMALAAWKKCLA